MHSNASMMTTAHRRRNGLPSRRSSPSITPQNSACLGSIEGGATFGPLVREMKGGAHMTRTPHSKLCATSGSLYSFSHCRVGGRLYCKKACQIGAHVDEPDGSLLSRPSKNPEGVRDIAPGR